MSKNAFAISLDKTATVIQHLVDERNKPGFDLMNKVVDVYPNVSIEWLLRGKGPMLLDGSGTSAAAAPALPKAASAAAGSPAPLFTAAAPRAPELLPPADTPSAASITASPEVLPPAAPPATVALPTIAPVAAAAPLAPPVAQQQEPPIPAPGPAAPVPAPAALDAAILTAALHAQHLQHQLALAEQRNQHLLEQQKLLLERQALMQQMLDFVRRPV